MKDIRKTINRKRFVLTTIGFIIAVVFGIILIACFLEICFNNQNDVILSSFLMLGILGSFLYFSFKNKDSCVFVNAVVGFTAIFFIAFAPLILSTSNVVLYLLLVIITFVLVLYSLGGVIYRISYWYKTCNFIITIMILELVILLALGLFLVFVNPFGF